MSPPTTALCASSADDVLIRGRSLPRELIGAVSFTEMFWLLLLGQPPSPAQTALLDAALVTLMEHGLTPSAVSARLTYGSAPEALQGAVAAGLLAVGSTFVGTMEGCGALLARIVAADDRAAAARDIAAEHRAQGRRVPGFGHPVHRPVDPRSVALLELAERHGARGEHCAALALLAAAVERASGRALPPNATAAIAAILADSGLPIEILRGVALVSRCAGLVAHIREEQQRPAMRALWQGAERAVPYEPSVADKEDR